MTALNYYRWSLLLPIVASIPGISFAFPGLGGGATNGAPEVGYEIPFVPYFVLFGYYTIGLPAYVLWVAFALRYLHGKDEEDARRLMRRAPWQVAPLTILVMAVTGVLSEAFSGGPSPGAQVWNALLAGLLMVPETLIVGYFWVGVVAGGRKLLDNWNALT